VAARGKRKERVGEVVSNKMTKTIVVRVERRFPHAKFKKVVTAYKKFYAHDEKARPRWATRCASRNAPAVQVETLALVEVVERGEGWTAVAA
jgi:small subunit ribosomal protein S17